MVLSGFAQCSILYQYIPVAASCDYPRRTQPKCPQYYTDEWNRGCKNAIIKVTVWAAVFGLKVVGCCCWLLSLLSVRYTLFFHIVHCPQFSMHASEQAVTSASFFIQLKRILFLYIPYSHVKSAPLPCVCVWHSFSIHADSWIISIRSSSCSCMCAVHTKANENWIRKKSGNEKKKMKITGWNIDG